MATVQPNSELFAPSGELLKLAIKDISPSTDNPRHLFDPEPLRALRESIREHGVLVPLTVYRPKGQRKYSILDGERRYRCCLELEEQGISIRGGIPANIVAPPDPLAGLLYMFSIHNFREEWELMPTALSLKEVMKELNEEDTKKLNKLTGLSIPQIERCKKLLRFPKKYQALSLLKDPKERIPSNFWIEALPIIELVEKEMPEFYREKGRDWVIERLVEKYRLKAVRSVIHFRTIMDAYNASERGKQEVIDTLKKYLLTPELDTKDTFFQLADESKRVQSALDAAEKFRGIIESGKLEFIATDENRKRLRESFTSLCSILTDFVAQLQGEDDPELVKQ